MTNCPKCNEPVKGNTKFCPSCGEKLGRMTADEKKARLTGEKKGGKAPFIIIGALVLAGAVAFGVLSSTKDSPTPISGNSATAAQIAPQVPCGCIEGRSVVAIPTRAPTS